MKNFTAANMSTNTAFLETREKIPVPVPLLLMFTGHKEIYINQSFSGAPLCFYSQQGVDTISKCIGSIFHSAGLT